LNETIEPREKVPRQENQSRKAEEFRAKEIEDREAYKPREVQQWM
jgi:hypothetical protein